MASDTPEKRLTPDQYYRHLFGSIVKGRAIEWILDYSFDTFTPNMMNDRAMSSSVNINEQLWLRLMPIGLVEQGGGKGGSTVYRRTESSLWVGLGALVGEIVDLSKIATDGKRED